jgi:putative sterol carrier protein
LAETGFIDSARFARLVRDATDEQLEQGFAMNRDLILGEVFRRMEEHFEPSKADGVDAVIEWRIRRAGGGDHDRWQVAIRDGSCRVTPEGDEPARVTFNVAPVDFIRLATGNASGPRLFLFGKLKIDGDLMFAARVQGMFRIPAA